MPSGQICSSVRSRKRRRPESSPVPGSMSKTSTTQSAVSARYRRARAGVERGAVGDRQALDHTGHPATVDPVQRGVPRPLVVGHRADPGPSAIVDLDVVGAILGPVLLDRNAEVQPCPCRGRAPPGPPGSPPPAPRSRSGSRRPAGRRSPRSRRRPTPGPGSGPALRRCPPTTGARWLRPSAGPPRALPGHRRRPRRWRQTCSSAPARWASSSSAWATTGMPPLPTSSGVRWKPW